MKFSQFNFQDKFGKHYFKKKYVVKLFILFLIVAALISFFYLLSVGELYTIPYDIIWSLLFYRLGFPFEVNVMGLIAYYSYEFFGYIEIWNALIFDIRMPRIMLAFSVGMGLSITGVAMQGLFKNPLADSYILGISSGAGLGATIAIYYNMAIFLKIWSFLNIVHFGGIIGIVIYLSFFIAVIITIYNVIQLILKKKTTFKFQFLLNIPWIIFGILILINLIIPQPNFIDVGFAYSISDFMFQIAISFFAFLFSWLITFLVYILARIKGELSTETLLLAGIAMAFIFSALSQLFTIFSEEKIHQLYLWGIGSFGGSDWLDVIIAGPFIILTSVLLLIYGHDLNIMVFKDDVAKSMGVNVQKSRRNLIILVSLTTAFCVAFTGPIAFIGLICPHIIRFIVGNDHRSVLPLSALFGGVFLVWMDFFAQVVLDPASYLDVFINGIIRSSLYDIIPYEYIDYIVPTISLGVDLPVGIITALIGGPFFLILLLIKRRKVFQGL